MEFLQFNNTIYFAAFAIISGLMLVFTAKRAGKGGISAKDAVQLSNTQHAQFIDIRTAEDFKKSAIPQSKNFPAAELESKISALPKKPLILVCTSGRTTQKAAQTLAKHNVEDVYWIKGGLNEWLTESLPVKSGNAK